MSDESNLTQMLCVGQRVANKGRAIKPLYIFGTTPCAHVKYGKGNIVSSTECYGNVSSLLCTIKFESKEELISLYNDEITILNDT
jgi:hypothetical protein